MNFFEESSNNEKFGKNDAAEYNKKDYTLLYDIEVFILSSASLISIIFMT